ncbi:MAG: pyrroline-5-carboxylate reductase [Chlorobi bacterium]|nr:pyrroline-5-carboxylate reductase [Chlorobiota bacterium]
MKGKRIAIIGGGNLGTAIARGLVDKGLVAPSDMIVTRRRVALLKELSDRGIIVTSDNCKAVKDAAVVILSVKPYQLEEIINEISPCLGEDTLVVSVATGVSAETIMEMTGKKLPVFRAMPNTAIEIGESMTCISSLNANQKQENEIVELFNHLGKAIIIPEELMSSATVLAACGIAYALRYIRASTQGGVEIGFGSQLALQIAAQTVKGAAELLIQKGNHPEDEIDKVTTPRGVTISGLNEMEHRGFSSSLIKGLLTSYNKIEKGK